MRSRPLWARELKHHLMFFLLVILRSRPLWARELKLLVILIRIQTVLGSRPLWARELKQTHQVEGMAYHRGGRAPCGRVN